jgi:hypothetical protein
MIGSLALALLLQAAPAPPVETFARGWAGAETVWTTSAEKRTLAVGWVEGQFGAGRFGVSGAAGALGLVGKFQPGEPTTYSALRVQLAGHWNAFALQAGGGVVCGPAAAVEGGVPLELQAGQLPLPSHTVTFGVGLLCSGKDWSTFQLAGRDVQLTGLSFMGRTHVPMSDRIVWVIRHSFGGQRRYVLVLDVVVRVF